MTPHQTPNDKKMNQYFTDITLYPTMSDPIDNKCIASCATSGKCTRKKQKNQLYCGTHLKKQKAEALLLAIALAKEPKTTDTVEVWKQNMNGILYYVDDQHNIYKSEDIIRDIFNPRVIGTYTYDTNTNTYVTLFE